MKSKKKPQPIYFEKTDEAGNIIKRIPMTAADDDWIRAGRLRVSGKWNQRNSTPLIWMRIEKILPCSGIQKILYQ